MRVRVLSEWAGSGRCGTVCDVPTPLALDRIRGGWAEPVPEAAPSPMFETAVVPLEVETAVAPERPVKPRGKGRG